MIHQLPVEIVYKIYDYAYGEPKENYHKVMMELKWSAVMLSIDDMKDFCYDDSLIQVLSDYRESFDDDEDGYLLDDRYCSRDFIYEMTTRKKIKTRMGYIDHLKVEIAFYKKVGDMDQVNILMNELLLA